MDDVAIRAKQGFSSEWQTRQSAPGNVQWKTENCVKQKVMF